MKKYQCHKIVEAAKITEIERLEGLGKLQIGVDNDVPGGEFYVVDLEPRFLRAQVGEYLVKYRNVDGSVYLSVSPAPEFEAGYTEIKQGE